MIVNTREMLEAAKKDKYAIPQFNINNLEWTRYILETCEEEKSPVILGVSEGAAKYIGGYKTVYNIVSGLMSDLNITIPVAIHLDHGKSYDSCRKAIDAGFTSVMLDGSFSSLDENIKMVTDAVNYAHPKNVTVEAEVGHIGGIEDGSIADIAYANLDDCIKLVNDTGIDSLAPALGSVHGLYNGKARIDINRMKTIRDAIKVPLVLHGGTGIDDETIRNSIESGICKVNINTELQVSWAKAVREFLGKDNTVYDPRKIIGSGEKAIKEAAISKINLFKSNNRA